MEKDFFNTQGAAEYLGVSIKTIYHYIHNRIIPHFKVQNRKVYFKKEDLDNFIFSPENRCSSKMEIQSLAAGYEEKARSKNAEETKNRLIIASLKRSVDDLQYIK